MVPVWPDFWKILLTQFFTLVAQIFIGFSGYSEKHCVSVKTPVVTFRLIMVNFGLLFILSSGHTDWYSDICWWHLLLGVSTPFFDLIMRLWLWIGKAVVGLDFFKSWKKLLTNLFSFEPKSGSCFSQNWNSQGGTEEKMYI